MLEERFAGGPLRLRKKSLLSVPLKAARPLLKRADFASLLRRSKATKAG